MDANTTGELRSRLLEQRSRMMNLRRQAEDSWQRLQEKEIEPQETAAKAAMAQGLGSLEERRGREIEKIDRALEKMDEGVYGQCEGCREVIQAERLRVLPWARFCAPCAHARESFEEGRPEDTGGPVGAGPMSDGEMEESIRETLLADGRVPMEEIDILCLDGVVHLRGAIPGETSRQVLQELIGDVLGFHEVEDELTVDRQLWETRERTPGERPPDRPPQEVMAEGEGGGAAPHTSAADGVPMEPPDTLTPEEPER